jgi:hypothetical protein
MLSHYAANAIVNSFHTKYFTKVLNHKPLLNICHFLPDAKSNQKNQGCLRLIVMRDCLVQKWSFFPAFRLF